MELKTKYQYTYFIHPYIIDKTKYDQYILKLFKDKRCHLKLFEKEKDMNLYNYFLPNFRNYIFPSFNLRGENLKEFKNLKIEAKSKIISEQTACFFNYNLSENIKGKVDNNSSTGIFFNIEKIEIICFNTGICFFVMKTNLEGTNKFSDILNFNYKFKDVYSELNSLKNYENIRIQTNTFKDVKDILEFIEQITGVNRKKKSTNKELLNDRFYTFSYACLESEFWNSKNSLENQIDNVNKYINVLPSNYSADFNQDSYLKNSIIDKHKYFRISITKQSSNLICSGTDTYNFTRLPYDYENEYLYTYIITLYQKIFLMKLNSDFKDYNKLKEIRSSFSKFIKKILQKEITLSDSGSSYYKSLKEVLEISELYSQIKSKYEVIYKDLNIEKNNRYYIILIILLIFSLCLNFINVLLLKYYLL